jgi:ribonuclease HI/probable phosphoglycerate mutase
VFFNLYTDGACRGNPGAGGAGIVLTDERGNTVSAVKHFLGHCTNNVAEYRALIHGLDEALSRRCGKLRIYLDSELLVNQIRGRYRVKNAGLLPLMREVRERLARLDAWTVEHVYRERNKLADALANEAIDETALGRGKGRPPEKEG